MLSGARVVVVVPAYEEAPRIERVLRTIPDFVDHVVVVDDASTDPTSERAGRAADSRVEVVTHGVNRGVGAAIVSGYRHGLALTSRPCDALAVMAGDGQMDPADLASLVEPIARGKADYVKGNRFRTENVRRVMPKGRFVGGQAFSWLTARATGLAISDSQCGYTVIGRAACLALDLDGLWPRYGYPNDLLGQLAVRGLRVIEVPVRAIYADEQSKLKLRHLGAIAGLVARAWVRRVRAEHEGRISRP